jgi:hypothetical protein
MRSLKSGVIETRRIISAIWNPIGSFLRNKTYTQAWIWKFPVNLKELPQLERYMYIRNWIQNFQPSKLVWREAFRRSYFCEWTVFRISSEFFDRICSDTDPFWRYAFECITGSRTLDKSRRLSTSIFRWKPNLVWQPGYYIYNNVLIIDTESETDSLQMAWICMPLRRSKPWQTTAGPSTGQRITCH